MDIQTTPEVNTATDTPAVEAAPEATETPKKRRRRQPSPFPTKAQAAILQALVNADDQVLTIKVLTQQAPTFTDDEKLQRKKSSLWVRSNLRKPVSAGWVEKTGRGTYHITASGQEALNLFTQRKLTVI